MPAKQYVKREVVDFILYSWVTFLTKTEYIIYKDAYLQNIFSIE